MMVWIAIEYGGATNIAVSKLCNRLALLIDKIIENIAPNRFEDKKNKILTSD